jgi:hypothetical protein
LPDSRWQYDWFESFKQFKRIKPSAELRSEQTGIAKYRSATVFAGWNDRNERVTM